MESLGLNQGPGDIPDGPVVKNLLCSAGVSGSVPGQGTEIPHAKGQLSLWATTRGLMCCNYCSLHATALATQIRPNAAK